MVTYGGLGGVAGGRAVDPDDVFEMTVNKVLGDKIRQHEKTACDMWSALTNVDWHHANGDLASYSFRAAGDLIAAIRGEGDYLDWYCSGEPAIVTQEIAVALQAEGWTCKFHAYRKINRVSAS
jgi:hypothetical protein